jgi:hypothetical protein
MLPLKPVASTALLPKMVDVFTTAAPAGAGGVVGVGAGVVDELVGAGAGPVA